MFFSLTGSSTIKRTIYRYHTVDLNKTQVVDNSAFLLTPLASKFKLKAANPSDIHIPSVGDSGTRGMWFFYGSACRPFENQG